MWTSSYNNMSMDFKCLAASKAIVLAIRSRTYGLTKLIACSV